MEWTQISIFTTAKGIDRVCDMLSEIGIDGVEIEDEQDFKDFLEENKKYWDYVDDDLMKEKSKLPIVTSYADAKKISPAAEDYFEKESKYTDFYSMLMPEIMPKGSEFGKGVVKI